MKNQSRRLAVRIPGEGWQANIATAKSNSILANISNISANGAYLTTANKFDPGSYINMLIKTPHVSFLLDAFVVRADTHGMGVKFVNDDGGKRNIILQYVSKYSSTSSG